MALGTSNISTTLVRDEIGESTNKVSELVLSPNVNYFGFNTPGYYNNVFWGKDVTGRTGTSANYPLGLFRGYDHDWVTRMMGGRTRISDDDYEATTVIQISVALAAPFLETKPDVTIDYYFTVQFSRQDDFHQGGGTDIITNVPKSINSTNETFTVSFENDAPPDGGAALAENETFYINVIRESSPERRWYIQGEDLITSNQGGDNYVQSFTVPEDPYTYQVYISDVTMNAWMSPEQTAAGVITVNADVRVAGTVDVEIEMSDTDSTPFSGNVTSVTRTADYGANSISEAGTTTSYDTSYTITNINWMTEGMTVYYRYREVGGSWSDVKSTIVQDTASQQ